MQVSAVNLKDSYGYNMSNSINNLANRHKDSVGDTSFNSLSLYNNKKIASADKLPMVFDSVNQWKNFCHQRIVGGKLDVIA